MKITELRSSVRCNCIFPQFQLRDNDDDQDVQLQLKEAHIKKVQHDNNVKEDAINIELEKNRAELAVKQEQLKAIDNKRNKV